MTQARFYQAIAALAMTTALGACTVYKEVPVDTTTRDSAQYNDDAAINGRVQAAVFGVPGVHANTLKIDTYRGVVQMTGVADSQDAALNAVNAARTVEGVKEVKYNINVN